MRSRKLSRRRRGMSGFTEWLEKVNAKDTKARAVLRRSLAFDRGASRRHSLMSSPS